MFLLRVILIAGLFLILNAAARAENLPDGYPYNIGKIDTSCTPPPALKLDDVLKIAEEAGLWKPVDGHWVINFGKEWNTTAFPNQCVWAVATFLESAQPGGEPTLGGADIFIQDTTKKFVLYPPPSGTEKLGARLTEFHSNHFMTSDGITMDLPIDHGIIVSSVSYKSPAALAGLAKGDVILSFWNWPPASINEVKLVLASIPPGRAVPMQVLRNKKAVDLTLQF